MAAGDVQVQSAVHSLDQGRIALLIRAGMFSFLILALSLLYLLVQFKGLNTPTAMDQAQIARNIAAGKGFTTGYIRPLALGMMQARQPENTQVDLKGFPDFYQAPLNPWVNSWALLMVKPHWKMSPSDTRWVYIGDSAIATVSVVLFVLSVGVWFFVLSRLFDTKLALFACASMLLTDLFWQFSLSGLPQMLVLLLFSLTMLATLFAMEASQREQLGAMIAWLIGAGIGMGLMTLAHGLSVWIFLGWLGFAGLYFRPRGLAALAALAAFSLVIAPWMVRNYQVCGNPFGLAIYDAFFPLAAEDSYARSPQVNIGGSGTSLQGKVRNGVIRQVEQISAFLGLNIVAGAFFLSLFHPFRSRKTFMFKWCVLLMWVFAVGGMALYQPDGAVSANQMHVVFIPLFIGFGMAFLFVLWNRLELGSPLLRIVFICAMLLVTFIPMGLKLFAGSSQRFHWPPYLPPFISILGDWFTEDEVICSDMPWAVSWYAQRYGLLMPESLKAFNQLHDYSTTKQPIQGLYLTPVSGNQGMMGDIMKGRYREWSGIYLAWAGMFKGQKPQLAGFPLPAFMPLPIEGESIIFADRDRWTQPRTTTP